MISIKSIFSAHQHQTLSLIRQFQLKA